MADLPIISPDSGDNADWTKQSWDLPPYKSAAFFEVVDDLDAFRQTHAYNAAVAAGLIVDDEWLEDHATPDDSEG